MEDSLMKNLKHYIWIGFFFVLITGTISHFIYDWTGKNALAGFFFPVNESVREHMKLIFFPMLAFSLLTLPKAKKFYPCIFSALAAGTLIGTFLIPIVLYVYRNSWKSFSGFGSSNLCFLCGSSILYRL